MSEEVALQYKLDRVNKWGISSYRVENAPRGGTVRFSKNAFAGAPPETLIIQAAGLQAGSTSVKEPRAPKAPKAPKDATPAEGIPEVAAPPVEAPSLEVPPSEPVQ